MTFFDPDALMAAIGLVISLDTFLFILLGVVIGISFGAIPGLAHTLPIAIALPLTLVIPFHQAMGLLIGTYKGGTYGGSITAISFATPGTSGAAATVADGYGLTKKGKTRKALQMALYSSIFGDSVSDIALIFLVVPIGMVAPKFGPAELTALYIMALALVVLLAADNPGKGMISAAVGFFLAVIGRDIVTGSFRFTMGIRQLQAGFDLIPFLMGFFAVPEIIRHMRKVFVDPTSVEELGEGKTEQLQKEKGLTFKELIGAWKGLGLGTLMGIFLGALPGPGATLSSYTSHSVVGQISKDEEYGKGSLEGVAAAEAANNATCGATFIPMLTFGVPGSSIAAMLMAALMMEGIPVGPRVMVDHTETVYVMFLLLLFANPFNFLFGKLLIPVYTRLTRMPARFLWPAITVLLIMGTYAYQTRPFDVVIMILSGIIGCFFFWFKITDGPLVLAFLVAPLFEESFRQALMMSGGDYTFFFQSNISRVLWAVTFGAIVWFAYKRWRNGRSDYNMHVSD
ncbi:tripartite tricarboxylate transporter permease [Halarsenatibacter silvermanii]|uniref:Putative tricarboxylic transport membrane protein n=1 Tax=Halarsenatibacter silvermanii TaxID=321763 RepID=A0A1G9J290_9FIRM|nr:tripartite tricarboxylate transporter permease [Halarsenatibacter silvermanii]SDL31254.1 putative tricarboxylic transport membrane protein [Halarsenatibacter silvermanii]